MQCRSHVSQLAKLHKQFNDTGAEFIIILGDTLEKAKRYVDMLKLPFPVLSDPEREVYRVYELEKYFRTRPTHCINCGGSRRAGAISQTDNQSDDMAAGKPRTLRICGQHERATIDDGKRD